MVLYHHSIKFAESGIGGIVPLDISSHRVVSCCQAGGNMGTIIRNTDFKDIARNVKPDAKKRVVLPKALVR